MPSIARIPLARYARAAASGEEVHVVAARDAASEHLRGGEQRSVVDEIGIDEAALARPDRLLEPCLERNVVGDAAKQRHRGMRVRVDQTRQQHVCRQHQVLARLVIGPRRPWSARSRRCVRHRSGANADPAAPAGSIGNTQRASRRRSTSVIGGSAKVVAWKSRRRHGASDESKEKAPHSAGLFRRKAPLQRLTISPLTSTSTRRFGARHAISSFMFF